MMEQQESTEGKETLSFMGFQNASQNLRHCDFQETGSSVLIFLSTRFTRTSNTNFARSYLILTFIHSIFST